MRKLIFATGNEGKMREIRMILSDLGAEILSLKEAGITADVEENGTTFEENAVIKAQEIMKLTKEIVLADDSGLEVDALGGEPGIYSARYMGYDTSYRIKNQNLIERLEGKIGQERSARFVCAVAAAFPDGYDPIFYLPEYGCYSGELPLEEKNKLSHRGKALCMMKEILRREQEAGA